MKIGITAFLTDTSMLPGAFARAVEEMGFDSLYLPEHTHLPLSAATPPALVEGVHIGDYRRGLDPWIALSAAASATERIALGTGVCLVAQRDPIVLAKEIATLDHISGGRVVLGMGFGWNAAEAADHGVDFATRHRRAREHVACMRALWRDDEAEFHGDFVSMEPSYSWPKPVQRPAVRILIGGGATTKVFDAIAQYGDGWMPIGGSGLGESLPRLRDRFASAGRDPATLHVLPFGVMPDDGKLNHYRNLGVTETVLRVPSGSPDSMRSCLEEYARFLA